MTLLSNNSEQESSEECIFCNIIKGTIPVYKVYEDDETLAFVDIHPTNKGHVLVIPKDHIENIFGYTDEIACRVAMTTRKLAVAIKHAVDADGMNIIMNNEPAGGQVIFHAHTHIIPRFNNDGLHPWPAQSYEHGEAETIQEKIKAELK